jgi:hypothetical protein
VLVELGVAERRYDAVKVVLEGQGIVTEVAHRNVVTRQACASASGATGSADPPLNPDSHRSIEPAPGLMPPPRLDGVGGREVVLGLRRHHLQRRSLGAAPQGRCRDRVDAPHPRPGARRGGGELRP